jgi:hypothetical protein
MQEIPARAALVSAPDVQGLTTSITREEIAEAMRTQDGPPELILDVTRFSDGEPTETRSVAVAWESADLEQLLRQAEGDRVTLTFDGEALRQAMEEDVEAHGLREKAVVLAVAVTAATGFAANAAAQPSPGSDDRSVARATVVPSIGADDRDLSRATSPLSLAADDRAVSRATPAEQPSLGADDRAVPRATPASQPSLGPDDRAVPRATPASQPSLGPDDRALPRTAPTSVTQQPGLSPDDRALPRTDPLSQPSLSPDDRALPRTAPVSQPVASTSDEGTRFEAPSSETIAVLGGIALAITGAAFAAGVASRRRVSPT